MSRDSDRAVRRIGARTHEIKTYASITAKPFFESRGYAVVKEQEVERSGVKLKNYEMLKIADK